jgi:dethiobiotin synthetase
MKFPDAFFITGTDTGVGKTLVAAILLSGLRGRYWKPVQSGTITQTDTDWVKSVTELPPVKFFQETYMLSQPLSPHASAKIDGVRISLDAFTLPDCPEPPLIVEGAGGLMVPLNETDLMIDLMQKLALPVVLVSRSGLGTINHTVLSLNALRARNIEVLGVVMNGERNPSNKEAIEQYGRAPVIAEIPIMRSINSQTLTAAFQQFSEENSGTISNLASVHANEDGGAAVAGKKR